MDHDGELSSVAYASLIQTCNRFLLEQMTGESESGSDRTPSLLKSNPNDINFVSKPPLAQLLRVEAKTVSVCTQCGANTSRESFLNVIDLVYPRRVRTFFQSFFGVECRLISNIFVSQCRLCRTNFLLLPIMHLS